MNGSQPPEDARYLQDLNAVSEQDAAELGVPYPDMVYQAEAAAKAPPADGGGAPVRPEGRARRRRLLRSADPSGVPGPAARITPPPAGSPAPGLDDYPAPGLNDTPAPLPDEKPAQGPDADDGTDGPSPYPAFPQGGVIDTGARMPIGGMLLRPDYPEDGEDEPTAPVIVPVRANPAAARSGRGVWTLAALVCAVLLAGMGLYVWQLYQGWQPFREKVRLVMGERIAQGVTIDGIAVGGMTREEAVAALSGVGREDTGLLSMTLQAEGRTWIVTDQELPLERNVQAMVDTAWSIGRQGSSATIASSVTPFEYRYRHLYHNAENPAALTTSVTYDRARVRELVDLAADYVDREPVDAAVSFFDPNTGAFAFSDEAAGVRVNRDALVRRITEELDQKRYTAVIRMPTETLSPRITKADLIGSYTRISTFTTVTTSDENRNTNIYLAAQAVNGRVVLPGETFSFNAATGERTASKGYLPAAAIAGGASVDEVGGGVCQVSSTLYNAAAMADMTIVERSPHTWPSTYVEMGRDATVNWPDLDFSFRNDRSGPIYIAARYQDQKCTVDIYGPSLGSGVTIELTTRLVSETPPPQEPVYEFNGDLPYGTAREKKKARTGYEVETYRVYLINGEETRRELLRPSSYPMIQQVLEYNY